MNAATPAGDGHDPRESRLAVEHPRAYLALHVLGGIVFTALLLWAFAALADAVFDNGRFTRADVGLSAWIQQHDTEYGESIFAVISFLGAPVLVALVAVVSLYFAWRRDFVRAISLASATASGAALNMVLKHLFHRGRPEFATEFITHATWSFPSGHAMESMVGYGMLAVLLFDVTRHAGRRRLLVGTAVLLILMIGVSRVYLGVHYLSDVTAGWLAGGAWLYVCATAYRFARWRLHPVTQDTETHAAARRSSIAPPTG